MFTRSPVAGALGLVLMVGCASDGGSTDVSGASSPVGTGPLESGDPTSAPNGTGSSVTPDTGADAVRPAGFTTVEVRVTAADGEVCEACLWLADTADERAQGLRGVTDLGGADGMLFAYDQPAQSNYVMIGTPTPLSIAWFGSDGLFVSDADMEPCLDADTSGCARYSAEDEFSAAIEVLQGDLDELGIGPGARLDIVDGSESPTCASAG